MNTKKPWSVNISNASLVRNQPVTKGFTLVELIGAVAIGMIMLLAIYAAINSAQRSSSGIGGKVTAQQDARTALEQMAMDIRMASYNSTLNNSIWVKPTNPPSNSLVATSNPTYKGIQEATPTSLTIEMYISPNTEPLIGGYQNEIIRYAYDTSNLQITREANPAGYCITGGSGAQSFLGAAVGSNPRDVLVTNNTVIQNGNGVYGAVFRYFQANGQEIYPTLALNGTGNGSPIPNIRRILITLAVQTQFIDPTTKQPRNLVYSTSVIPMNHGINP